MPPCFSTPYAMEYNTESPSDYFSLRFSVNLSSVSMSFAACFSLRFSLSRLPFFPPASPPFKPLDAKDLFTEFSVSLPGPIPSQWHPHHQSKKESPTYDYPCGAPEGVVRPCPVQAEHQSWLILLINQYSSASAAAAALHQLTSPASSCSAPSSIIPHHMLQ